MQQRLHAKNQQGFALITVLFLLVLITAIGIAATRTSNLESLVAGNNRQSTIDFYNQELSLAVGDIDYKSWLTDDYLTSEEDSACFPEKGNDGDDDDGDGITDLSEIFDENDEVIGSYRVRNIVSEDSYKDIDDWEDLETFGDEASKHPANDVPFLSHTDKPNPGSGYDPKNFEIRRYAITAYSVNNDTKGKVILQEGVFMAFNKYD